MSRPRDAGATAVGPTGATLIAWVVVVFFVPVWVGIAVGPYFAAVTLATLVAVGVHLGGFRFEAIDALMLGFLAVTVLLFAVRQVQLSALFSGALDIALPYIWGRIAAARIPGGTVARVIAAAAAAVAALALIEFATGANPFAAIPGNGASRALWATLQPRAEFLRAEGAFGHSIALGAVLAMCSAFLLAAPVRDRLKAAGILLLGAAVVVTFSRIGLITFVITVVIALVALPGIRARTRWLVGGILTAAAGVAVPFLGGVYAAAGQEAGGSASYRGDLGVLLTQVQLIGGVQDWQDKVVGDVYLGSFAASTDNAFLSMLLRYGYLPTAAMFGAYAAAIGVALWRRRVGPAAVALLGQLPGLFAVAFITQYGIFVWFVVGMAVSESVSAREGAPIRPLQRATAPALPRGQRVRR